MAASAILGAAPAAAAPSASATSTYLWVADPFPFGVETVHATVTKPGVVHFTVGRMCAGLNPSACVDYSMPMSVAWVNFATGATGTLTVDRNGATVKTGRGTIGLGAMFGTPAIPGATTINA
ncbi:MAG: hypothetical protein QM774_10490 [Gordonia sp. (in: high G+C Gram-positive bacteria)]|uniref:hypothetical protein n=1 Tax=Gordonia sp. (in: high G+C Gram-positive bacteria) TaxID=84139 RepID=UPI0039E3A183